MSKFRPNKDLAIPLGSLLLVTGVSGMIAIHIVDEALKAGFHVRGTVRSREKGEAATKLLKSHKFDYVIVKDMAADRAFHEAMKDVSAVIHSASITNFSSNIEEVIPPTVKGTNEILQAALANPSVKRVVFTSTSSAASGPMPGVKLHIGQDTWNEGSLEIVKSTPKTKQAEMGFEWAYQVYVASKIEAEKAAWGFVENRKPPFVVNVINPSMNWGKLMGSTGVSGRQLLSILDGKIPSIPSVWMVDTIDDARIHIAAAIDSAVANERIFACDSPFNWRLVIETIHRILPDLKLPTPDPNESMDITTIDNDTGAELLKKWWGQPGYKGLEQTIRETLEMCLTVRNYK